MPVFTGMIIFPYNPFTALGGNMTKHEAFTRVFSAVAHITF